eukprot:TRINITY_DN2633_c0_g1_i1.p1 TRINITY_DN2633_c0_g1~~TRINITY_DN2633_c0_g1_i1.p1  ORF type:complete len:134 (-),score=48.96 TRINITY_DN2633_c0_g1_i1:77-478(-)
MIRRPPRSTQSRSSAASDVYKRQVIDSGWIVFNSSPGGEVTNCCMIAHFYPGKLPKSCVEDTGRRGQLVWFWCETVFLSGDSVKGEFPYSALIPVSYTHLRAHETVLDLVCRLLLEKKKKQKKKIIKCQSFTQ